MGAVVSVITVVAVAAAIVGGAWLLPRLAGLEPAARPPFGGRVVVAVVAGVAFATVIACGAGGVVADIIAEHVLALQLVAEDAQAVVTSPDAGAELAHHGARFAFALLAAPFAALALARAATQRRDLLARVAVASLAGEVALTAAHVALLHAFAPTERQQVRPLVDVVANVASIVDTLVGFTVAGVVAGIIAVVVSAGPARTRPAGERRALLVAGCAAPPAALFLAAAATPSPDVYSQLLLTFYFGAAWVVGVGVGLLARLVSRSHVR